MNSNFDEQFAKDLLEYEVTGKPHTNDRAKYGMAYGDWFSGDAYLYVVLHNVIYGLAKKSIAHPAHLTEEGWRDELLKIAGKIKWLYNFDRIESDTSFAVRGELHDNLLEPDEDHPQKRSASGNLIMNIWSDRPENDEWYNTEVSPALDERRAQINKEVFSWLGEHINWLWG